VELPQFPSAADQVLEFFLLCPHCWVVTGPGPKWPIPVKLAGFYSADQGRREEQQQSSCELGPSCVCVAPNTARVRSHGGEGKPLPFSVICHCAHPWLRSTLALP